MAKIRLADLRLSLAPGEKKRISEGNGLTLILTGSEKGTSYKFQHRCTYAGKRREKILKTQELADARRISLERMELVEKGLDPDAEPEKELTVSDAVTEYQQTLTQRDLSQNTRSYRIRYSNRIDEFFGEREVKALTEHDIHDFITAQKEQHGIHSAKRTLDTFSLILRAAHIIHAVPVPSLAGMHSMFQAPSVVHRAALTEGDISDNILKIFLSFDAQKHRDFMLLAFMLLMRKQELCRIRKDDVNFDEKVLLIRKTKTLKSGFRIPITDRLETFLRYLIDKSSSPYLITGSSRSQSGRFWTGQIVTRLRELQVGQSIHGIRSVGRMWMHQNKIPFEVAESCLTHVVGNKVTRAYLRTDYFEERREALEKWHEFLHETLYDIMPVF
jgi:integrase